MKVDMWTIIATSAHVISVILASVALFQFRLARLSLRTSTIAELYRQQNALNMFFVEHQRWRPFFYEGRPIVVAHGEQQVKELMTIAEMVTDLIEHVFVQLPNLKGDIKIGWENYIKNLYQQSPAIRQHLNENGMWYSEKLVVLLQEKVNMAKSRGDQNYW
jgi:hypothetical protein